MNQLPDLLHSQSSLSSALTGGQAPTWWGRQLVKETSSLKDLQWACAWHSSFVSLNPRLSDGPLLGRSLPLIIEEFVFPNELKQEDSCEKPHRSSLSEFHNEREHDVSSEYDKRGNLSFSQTRKELKKKRQPSHHVSVLSQLEPKANRDLLCRLANDIDPAKGNTGKRPQPTTKILDRKVVNTLSGNQKEGNYSARLPERIVKNERQVNKGEVGKQGGVIKASLKNNKDLKAEVVAEQDKRLHHEWMNTLARRVERFLNEVGMCIFPTDKSLYQLSGFKGFSMSNKSARSLEGTSSSHELLNRLAGKSIVANEDSGYKTKKVADMQQGKKEETGQTQIHTSPVEPDIVKGSSLLGQLFIAINRKPVSRELLTRLVDKSIESDKEYKFETQQGTSKTRVKENNSDISKEPGSLTKFMPTMVDTSLPPLHTPQQIGQKGPQVAVTTMKKDIQQKTQEQKDVIEGDLSTLATSIKCILDEEARRYGIDV
jgi:hypothetical protein